MPGTVTLRDHSLAIYPRQEDIPAGTIVRDGDGDLFLAIEDGEGSIILLHPQLLDTAFKANTNRYPPYTAEPSATAITIRNS